MRTALSRRTGPVFMDVPNDVLFGAADLPEAPEHHRKHQPAEVAIFGHVKAALGQLAQAVTGAPARDGWLATLRETEAAGRKRDEAMTGSDSSPVHPARLIAEVNRFADRDAIIV